MDSPPPPASTSAAPPFPEAEVKVEDREQELVHRTKVIQFLGRTAPIILQNDNGPCPLLAICNVLSLKNSLNLSPDIPEVSQEKLLSLVAERLIDSNSNIDNKDTGYLENQQQNIADAIDILPRLTTGIDVNLKFRRIDDFEFTRECAIFDLLDIPLYHGWIVDPQDPETADAIGSKSYNTLMGELVSLETQTMENEQKSNNQEEDDSVDFVAATTAALGVPSPSLSRGQSFDDSRPSTARKGDVEEEAELLRILKLSEHEKSNELEDGDVVSDENLQGKEFIEKSEVVTADSETVKKNVTDETVKTETLVFDERISVSNQKVEDKENNFIQPIHEETRVDEKIGSDAHIESENVQPVTFGQNPPSDIFRDNSTDCENHQDGLNPSPDQDGSRNLENGLLTASTDLKSSGERIHNVEEHEAFTSSADTGEPIYEGEERILEKGAVVYENREPVYEGEGILAEQLDRGCLDDGDSKDRISFKQGELIRNFMKNSASQLTICGLFCLQEKVKERELCVFFRNNHFNTMFKYEGELYILATDQGYINQPDLVWEKLNEVNGDTLYMMGNFKEFKMDDHSNSTWDEQNSVTNTTDYLASIDGATQEQSSFNSDLQLAIALQQQEFEQQQQPQPAQTNLQQPAVSGNSRMVIGPQVPRNRYTNSSTPKPESKSKEKCIVM